MWHVYRFAEVAAFPAMHDPNPIGDLILEERAQAVRDG